MEFSRKEYWSGLPFLTLGVLLNPEIKPMAPAALVSSAVAGGFFTTEPLGKPIWGLEKEMATHSSILSWRIPWTEESGRLQFMWSQEPDTT